MSRLLELVRRRAAERRRVESFLGAIRATATPIPPRPTPLPLPRVEPIDTPHGVVWQLDRASRARLGTDTAALPRVIARASAPLR